ncbi:hypothetical protein BOQ63_000515 (plasmid) [Streptomyces viridifaciens]|nr:hypothetical protein BOQ63_000515 [Streptomyces viridifaciens]
MSAHEHAADLAAIKARIPSADQLFSNWPAILPTHAAHAELDLFEIGEFHDPRLVLYTGVSQKMPVTVAWALFGTARNVRPGRTALPAARETLTGPEAVRALQLLAVDNPEADEAAIETLALPGVTRQIAELAADSHRHYEQHAFPARREVGAYIYAYHGGPIRFGAVTADIVVIGSPIWIGTADEPADIPADQEETPKP